MASTRHGDPAMGRFLQHLLIEWLKATDESEAEFSRLAGLSRAAVNKVKNSAQGGGPSTVEGFARALRKTTLQLYQERDQWRREEQGLPAIESQAPPDRPLRFGDLPEWAAHERAIRATRSGRRFGEAAWESARNTNGGKLPAHLDQLTVLRLVELWQDMHEDPDGSGAAEQREIEAKTEEARKKKAAGAEDTSPHPPTAKPKSGPRGRG